MAVETMTEAYLIRKKEKDKVTKTVGVINIDVRFSRN